MIIALLEIADRLNALFTSVMRGTEALLVVLARILPQFAIDGINYLTGPKMAAGTWIISTILLFLGMAYAYIRSHGRTSLLFKTVMILGEGTLLVLALLSAYTGILGAGDDEARKLALIVTWMLPTMAYVLSLLGVLVVPRGKHRPEVGHTARCG